MRIDNSRRIGAAAAGAVRTAGGTGFSLPSGGGTAPAGQAAGTVPAPGVDALLALQAVPAVGDRRRRALARGRRMIDALDALRIGLLDGSVPATALAGLRAALAERSDTGGDAALEDALAAVELRAEVELAKLSGPAPA